MGTLNYFLGIQITPTAYGLQLTQSKYASNLLHRFNMPNANSTKTPCNPSTRLTPYDGIALSDPSNIEVLLRLYNIWHLHDLILLLVFRNCVNFYIILPLSTLKLQKGFWGMSRVLFTKEFFFLLVLWAFLPLLLQIGLKIPVTESPLLALLFSWGPILSLGHLRSKQQCLDHPWKLNIEL